LLKLGVAQPLDAQIFEPFAVLDAYIVILAVADAQIAVFLLDLGRITL